MHEEPDPAGTPPYGQDANSPTVPRTGQASGPYPVAGPGTPPPTPPAQPGAWPTPPAPPAWPQQGAWPPPSDYTPYDPWRAYTAPALATPPQATAEPRLSKPEALRRVSALKRAILAGSVVAFGVLAGLAAIHRTGITSTQAAPAPNDDSSTTAPFATPAQDNGGFFNQQPGGSGFGSNAPFQPPVSGSGVS